MNFAIIRDYLIARMKEKSTWAGLASIAIALGLAPQIVSLIPSIGDIVIAVLPIIGGMLVTHRA